MGVVVGIAVVVAFLGMFAALDRHAGYKIDWFPNALFAGGAGLIMGAVVALVVK